MDFLLFTPVTVVVTVGNFSLGVTVFVGVAIASCVVFITVFILDNVVGDNIVGVIVVLELFDIARVVVVFTVIDDRVGIVVGNGIVIKDVIVTSCPIVAGVEDPMDGASAVVVGTIFVDNPISSCDVISSILGVMLGTALRVVDST